MTKEELIEFGHKLVAKGRTPTEIHNAIAAKASSKDELNEVLDKVFVSEMKITNYSADQTKVLLDANRLKLNHQYSQKGLLRIAIMILVIGGITLGLSQEEVNQNTIFGWLTIAQGAIVTVLFLLVRFNKMMDLILIALISYTAIMACELIFWGIPNDLLEAYNHTNLNVPPSLKLRTNTVGARLIGYIFPFLYLGLKLFLGWFLFVVYRNYKSYNDLSQDIKDELQNL